MDTPLVIKFNDDEPFEGRYERVSGTTVVGWARKKGNSAPLEIELVIDDRIVCRGTADRPIKQPGIEHPCGFEIDVPRELLDGRRHHIRASVCGAGWPVSGFPQTVAFSPIVRAVWRVEGGQIVGSVIMAVDEPAQLDIYADGRAVDSFTVQGPARETTYFARWIPWILVDGNRHEMRIRSAGAGGRDWPTTDGRETAIFWRSIRSCIDSVEHDVISGWAFDIRTPNDELDVVLYDGTKAIAKAKTRIMRADVNQLFNISGTHGFTLNVPPLLFDGRERDLRLVARDTVLTSGFDKAKIPSVFGTAEGGRERYAGKIEAIDSSFVRGWAVDRSDPFRPVHVVAVVDGIVESVALADRFEKRLERLTPSGHHGFWLALPPRLSNGAHRTIEVKLLECDLALADDSGTNNHSVFFPLIKFDKFTLTKGLQHTLDRILATPAPVPNSNSGISARKGKRTGAVSLIVLNWNGAHLLRNLLRSIRRIYPSFEHEIVIVDHGSADDSREALGAYRNEFDIKLIARDRNYSFSESNNEGVRRADGDYLFFLNNDIVLTHDVISRMAQRLKAEPDLGVIGIRLMEPLPRGGDWEFVSHHRGIHFVPKRMGPDKKTLAYFPAEIADDRSNLALSLETPAVTAAALMCRKADFLALGGFDEAYFYGLEDVDFCLRMANRLNKRIVCDTSLTAIHCRSATRQSRTGFDTNPVIDNPLSQSRNAQLYAERFAYHVRRATLRALIEGHMLWSATPLRVALAVTDASDVTRAGDFFTAMELGTALHARFGWDVSFLRYKERDISGIDLLIALRPDFALTAIEGGNPGLITAAWIRNRLDEWMASDNLARYDAVFCSSSFGVERLTTAGYEASVFPIAANPDRFHPDRAGAVSADVVFVGNYWGVSREGLDLIDPKKLRGSLAVYGSGWDEVPDWAPYWKGALPYEQVGDVYAAAKIVIDDTHPVARDMHSLNSRVFDATAAGALVITNCAQGARAVFSDDLPTFADAAELNRHLRYFLRHEKERRARVDRLRRKVLNAHTYMHRADALAKRVAAVAAGYRICIKVGVPRHEERERWGDWHFARGLKRALNALGHRVRIDILPEWEGGLSASDDIVIVLRGLSRYEPKPGLINLMWLISHPDVVSEDELRGFDHVFVASTAHAEHLAHVLGDRVSPLLQCSDPDVFRPCGTTDVPELPAALFVGNSRRVRRQIVEDALTAGLDFGVYGGDWSELLPPGIVKSHFVPNGELYRYYGADRIVLNDHWPDMRRQGFLSNRLFDAGLCGAAVISDEASGLQDVFGDAIATYRTPADLKMLCSALSKSKAKRRSMGRALRRVVLENHTFAHRAAAIMDVVKRCAARLAGART